MSKFRFRLETLLKIRAADRGQQRAELAQAYQADRVLGQQVQQLTLEQETMRRSARVAAEPGVVRVDALVATHRYELLLETQIVALKHQVNQLQEEIERRRAALVESDQQVQILEKLREQQRVTHQADASKQDLKELDEIGGQSVWRKLK